MRKKIVQRLKRAWANQPDMTVTARVSRDVLLIMAGIFLVLDTPPSIQQAGITGFVSNVWAAMIGLGALSALLGVTLDKIRLEVSGCITVGMGFVVWTVASLNREDATFTTAALACVFLSGTAGQFYRVGMVLSGRVVRK